MIIASDYNRIWNPTGWLYPNGQVEHLGYSLPIYGSNLSRYSSSDLNRLWTALDLAFLLMGFKKTNASKLAVAYMGFKSSLLCPKWKERDREKKERTKERTKEK